MCGICGELRLDGQAAEPEVIARMQERLMARGPDGGGLWHSDAVALGHRRLSIIDLSARADQPMHDTAARNTLVFNGTIYNYPELRRALAREGCRFVSTGDTEVILKAYARWGEACVERLEGMFAFALWDAARQQLFLARDRFGIKPLYFCRDFTDGSRRFRFASTLPALLAGGNVAREIDPAGLQFQFTLHGSVPAPHTIFQAVHKLPPATTLTVAVDGTTRERRYWRLEAQRPQPEPETACHLADVREKLEAAVASHHRVADVPVGVFLSGGLDSSLLVALLSKQGASDLSTFSIGFADQPEEAGDEFHWSDLVARAYGTRHTRYRIADTEMLAALPDAIAAMSEPMFSQDNVAFYLLAREVKKEVKAVLSGQGADEAFGGYYWYPQMAATDPALPPRERFAPCYLDRDFAAFQAMLAPAWQQQARDRVGPFLAERLAEPGAATFMDSVFRLDLTTLLVDDPVKRVDNMTMAWGLEARVPFLDRALVEAAMRLPPELKLREGGKFPLKHIARGLLPDALIDRPKGYFPTPALRFLRGGALEFVRDVLNDSACRQRGLFDRAWVEKLLAEPLSHFTPLHGNMLWHLAALEIWLQQQEKN
ncbi:MAG: N-acetylglutaminylglutamine amidotransferase [Zoogloeaceae bacterium]|jgi:asparagine synthase (glutamine-hydrolysing)|nr:N-acetylglutaminylglutamine amidotransferase [Zoogloeaceae bacterium]